MIAGALEQAGDVDELVLIVPAGVALAVLTLVGYRIKKKSGKAERIERAHRPPRPPREDRDGS